MTTKLEAIELLLEDVEERIIRLDEQQRDYMAAFWPDGKVGGQRVPLEALLHGQESFQREHRLLNDMRTLLYRYRTILRVD